MITLRERFTKWYFRKGYRMEYRSNSPTDVELIFRCPFWVRPLVEYLFSPSVYYREIRNDVWEAVEIGLLDTEDDTYETEKEEESEEGCVCPNEEEM